MTRPSEHGENTERDEHSSQFTDQEIETLSHDVQFPQSLSPGSKTPASKTPQSQTPWSQTPQSQLSADGVLAGRYELRERMGQGGFGEVWRAYDSVLDKIVAIKRPRPDRHFSEADIASFLKEARKTASLKHPRIVAVHNAERAGDSWFIVSDFIDGSVLSTYMTTLTLTNEQIALLVAEIADALQIAHRQGLVHRDVKPSNILVDRNGTAFLTDFGLSVTEDEQVEERNTIAGSTMYMSPEQVRGETQFLDGRTDIYSLGVVLYHLLTGRRPFQGSNRAEVFEQILTRQARPPRMIRESIPRELERICLKCLSKPVSERYLTASDLAQDLRRWVAMQRSPARILLKKGLVAIVSLGLLFTVAWIVVPLVLPQKPSLIPQQPTVQGAVHGKFLKQLIWPQDVHSEWKVTDSDSVRVYCAGDGLLAVGEVGDGDLRFDVDVQQLQWKGKIGVFYGFQADRSFGEYHTIQFHQSLIRSWELSHNERRFRAHLPQYPTTTILSPARIGNFTAQKNKLSLLFCKGELVDVQCNEVSVSPEIVRAAGKARGFFGVCMSSGSGVFSDFRLNGRRVDLLLD